MNKKEECDYCIKRKTIYCPNSSECYSLDNLPYFKTKEDILKNIDTINKGIDELINELEKHIDYCKNDNQGFHTICNQSIMFELELLDKLKKLKGE